MSRVPHSCGSTDGALPPGAAGEIWTIEYEIDGVWRTSSRGSMACRVEAEGYAGRMHRAGMTVRLVTWARVDVQEVEDDA